MVLCRPSSTGDHDCKLVIFVPLICPKALDISSLIQKTKHYRGYLDEILLAVAKIRGRDRPISVEVTGCARVACTLRPIRSIPVAIFLSHDAQIAVQTMRF